MSDMKEKVTLVFPDPDTVTYAQKMGAVLVCGVPEHEKLREEIVRAVDRDHLFDELVEALNRIAAFPKAAEQTGHGGDYQAGLELAASYAVVALAKVEASDG